MHPYLSLLFMVIIVLTIILMLLLGFVSLLTGKPISHILNQVKFEIIYNVLGLSALLDDWVLREKDITSDLPMGSGRTALITGGARGIGAEVVKKLLQRDLHVIIGCRNVEAGKNLFKRLRDEGITTGSVDVHRLDLDSLASIREFAKVIKDKYKKIHTLINNAGKMFGPYVESVDGFESQFATNYLGHFLLTHLLLPEIIAAGEPRRYARIVNVTSCAHVVGDIKFHDINHREHYISSEAYAQSKLAQVLFSNHLNSLMKDENKRVGVYSVHPGIVNTDLFKEWYIKKAFGSYFFNFLFKTPAQGAISIIYTCLGIKLEIATGTYISNCQITPMALLAYSTNLQKKLFEFTNNLLGIKEFGKE
ncbi:hypothetical protein RN001_003882 [Aquatica leii]|uniref:Uncharacterized protein n=1 Tax=Aquatica leii TaxID=1421715 RepID=A0AAN7SEB9_9COLE|nr:hypothetical protein RN001_003882 [Aquatica leii]